MKEYNLKDNTVDAGLPTEYGAFNKLKKFFTLELTPYQAKVLGEVRDFWCQEISFPEVRDFFYQDVDLAGVKDFWTQEDDFKEIKDFWCQDINSSFWNQEVTFK